MHSPKKVISDNPIEKKTGSLTTATAPEICTDIVSTKEVFLNKIHKEIVSNKEETQSGTVAVPTTAQEVVSNKEGVSSLNVGDVDDDEIDNEKFQSSIVAVPITTTTTTIVNHTRNVSNNNRIVLKDNMNLNLNINNSKEEWKEPADVSSNLNGIAAAAAADIDNAKLPLGCKNSIGDLDGIKDEYYQVKANNKDDEYWKEERSYPTIDTNNPTHKKCIHFTNITNDGEILLLPLFSLVYRAEQSVKLKNNVLFHNDNASSINNEPYVGITVIDDDTKYGVTCDRSDDTNPLPLPLELSSYNIIMPYIHSTNTTNDGEILLLPLFSLLYWVEQSDEVNTLIDEVYQVEQFDEMNTLIEKVNEEYPF